MPLTPLQSAIYQASDDKRQESTLRQMVAYAAETADLSVVLVLGRKLDETLTRVMNETVPPSDNPKPVKGPARNRGQRKRVT